MNLTDLVQEYEAKQIELQEAQARLDELKAQLVSQLGGAPTEPPRPRRGRPPKSSQAPVAAKSRSKGTKFFGGREYWENKRKELLDSMEPGALYTGKELESLVTAEGGPETFLRQVRQKLLQSKKLKKVAQDGGRWKKGMFPGSARWTKA